MSRSTATARARLRAVLPQGNPLDDTTWNGRHWSLAILLLLHVPVLPAVAIAGHVDVSPAVVTVPVMVALAVAVLAGRRLVRSLAVAAGLTWSSTVLVLVSGGAPGMHMHLALVIVGLALYQAWAPLLLPVIHGVLLMGVAGQLAPQRVLGPAALETPSRWALLSCLLVLVACGIACAWWLSAEREQSARRTASRRLASREAQVTERLAAVEAVKTQLLAVVAHEFRTPLTSITGFARTLAARTDELDSEAVRTCLDGIDHHARRLTRLVHNVIAASGDVSIDHTAVTDLARITRRAAQDATEIHGQPAVLHVAMPDHLFAAMDPVAAGRILVNLCDNAVKFAPRGSTVDMTGFRDGHRVVVELANEASGLSARDLDRFFEPFVQADSSDTRPVEGMGLGLHVARRVARAHDGDLAARTCGRRVIFRLTLPTPARLPHRHGVDRLEVVRGDLDVNAR